MVPSGGDHIQVVVTPPPPRPSILPPQRPARYLPTLPHLRKGAIQSTTRRRQSFPLCVVRELLHPPRLRVYKQLVGWLLHWVRKLAVR